MGAFACYDNDIDMINSYLQNEISSEIHLKDTKSPEELRDTVTTVSRVLSDMSDKGVKLYAGGIVFSNPENVFKETLKMLSPEEYPDKNYALQQCVYSALALFSLSLANTRKDVDQMHFKFIFAVSGNESDFKSRMNAIREQTHENLMRLNGELKRRNKQVYDNLPKITYQYASVKSSKDQKGLQLADVFAHIANRMSRSDPDPFCYELHKILYPHFNIYNELPQKQTIVRGVFDLHQNSEMLDHQSETEYLKARQR